MQTLDRSQQDRAGAARAALAEESPGMYELAGMAERLGALEYHLAEMLALVAELAAP